MDESAPSPAYLRLAERLNRFPQGAAPTPALYKILQALFSEREAELVACIPIKPFSARSAARIWGMPLAAAQNVLDGLAARCLLIDAEWQGETQYVLPPAMAGFFEFSMMRTRGDIDQKMLAELFHQYCSREDDFFRGLFSGGETQQGRIFVNEDALPETHVLDYERASQAIREAHLRGVGLCYCRHKASLLDGACQAPLEICMTFDNVASALSRRGYARVVDVQEGLDLLQQAYAHNLVQFGENARRGITFLCNCCGCCCEALGAARRFGVLRPIHTSNYLPVLDESLCNGCGKCADACPVEALGMVSANDSQRPRRRKARLAEEICLGCGVCARVCPQSAIRLQERPQRVITPLTSTQRIVAQALERGTLQDLIFDNRALASQRALASLLGALLRLPPVQRTLASRQVKSRYLETLISRLDGS